MTDIEIDRALALAIGYQATKVQAHESLWVYHEELCQLRETVNTLVRYGWRVFSHRDWNVIGPIAEKYNCFPLRLRGGAWEAISRGKYKLGFFNADTPQKAIALSVIGALT